MALDATGFYVKEVKTILVGAHPDLIALVGTQTCDAVFAYHVAAVQTVAHIVEIALSLRLHEYALLEHAHPDVSRRIFYNAGNLALGKIYFMAEQRIILQESCYRIIYEDTHTIATDKQALVAADIDVVNRKVAYAGYLGEGG